MDDSGGRVKMPVINKVKIIIAVVGLISVVIGLIIQFSQPVDYTETRGVIDRIEVIESEGQEPEYKVYVLYNVGGIDYYEELGYYDPDYTKGTSVRVFYDPLNPENIHGDDKSYSLHFIVIGVLLLWAALCLTVLPPSGKRKKNKTSQKT